MPLDLLASVEKNLQANYTRPVYLIAMQHAASWEYLSVSGDVEFDGIRYQLGGARIVSIRDSQKATIVVPSTAAREAQVQNGVWRGGRCIIYHIPALPGDSPSYTPDDAFVVIDGEIQSSEYSGSSKTVRIDVTHSNNLARRTPAHTWDQLTSKIPAPGTIVAWEGKELVLAAKVPGTIEQYTVNPSLSVGGRLSPQRLKQLSEQRDSFTVNQSAIGAALDVIYGNVPVTGKLLFLGNNGANKVFAYGWGYGELSAVERFYINDQPLPIAGVTAKHYLGTPTQQVDSTLLAADPTYNDDFVIRSSEGDVGAAYTVLEIEPGAISGVPTVKAVFDGQCVFDPRVVGVNDPAYADTQFAVNFADPVDLSQNGHSFELLGDATIADGLLTPGAGAAHVPHDASLLIADKFEQDIRFTLGTDVTTEQFLFGTGTNAGNTNRGLALVVEGGNLRLRASSDGTTWDVADKIVQAVTAGQELVVSARRYFFGAWFMDVIVNGEEAVPSEAIAATVLHAASAGLAIGGRTDGTHVADSFKGTIRQARLNTGDPRATNSADNPISAQPFPEYARYSDNSALCFGDLVASRAYGLGRQVLGLDQAADFCQEIINGVERCRLALTLSEPGATLASMDLLAEYSACVYFNEGRDVRLKPDRPVTADAPCGQEIADTFDSGVWSQGDGWSIVGTEAVCNGLQSQASTLSQSLVTEDAVDYAIRLDVVVTAGTYSVELGGTEVIADGGSGSHTALVTASGQANDLRLVVSAGFVGTVSLLSCKRRYWLETRFVKDSLSYKGLRNSNTPNSIQTRYRVPDLLSANWPETVTPAIERPEVASGDELRVPTTLYLKGIWREKEALNKAVTLERRSINPTEFEWLSRDYAARFRKSDIMELRPELVGVHALVWVDFVELVPRGDTWLHRIRGRGYTLDHHPTDIPAGNSIDIPLKGVVFNLRPQLQLPDDWQDFGAANGHFLMIADDNNPVGQTGGQTSHPGFEGDTSESSGHDTPLDRMKVKQPVQGSQAKRVWRSGAATGAPHKHRFKTGELIPDLYRREVRLMQKVNVTSSTYPKQCGVLGLPGIVAPNRSRLLSQWAGRLLQAAAANAPAGVDVQVVNFKDDGEDDRHGHWQDNTALESNKADGLGPPGTQHSFPREGGGLHVADFSLVLDADVRRLKLAAYGGSDEFSAAPGDMIFWPADPSELAPPWYWLIGQNGLPDPRGRFIEIAALGEEGELAGLNTISLSGQCKPVAHNHKGPTVSEGTTTIELLHGNDVEHWHTMAALGLFKPKHFNMHIAVCLP